MAGMQGRLWPRGDAHVTDAALGAGALRAHIPLHSWYVRALLSDTSHRPNARVCHGPQGRPEVQDATDTTRGHRESPDRREYVGMEVRRPSAPPRSARHKDKCTPFELAQDGLRDNNHASGKVRQCRCNAIRVRSCMR